MGRNGLDLNGVTKSMNKFINQNYFCLLLLLLLSNIIGNGYIDFIL